MVVMEKGGLKLKLKLGSTPEPPPADQDMDPMDNSTAVMLSDEEEEEMGENVHSQASIIDETGKERLHKKSKKKKKKKEKDRHKHKRERSQQDLGCEGEEEGHINKMIKVEAPPAADPAVVTAAIKDLLAHLLRQLEKKDTNQFFIEPVTDAIAPGYSSIITQPMCFATMRDKVAGGLYTSVQQYEGDVQLIVSNCLKYNGPDTVYYSAGKKLLAAAQSVLGREKLLTLKKDIPSIAVLPPAVLGFALYDTSEGSVGGGGDSAGEDRTDSPNSGDTRSDCEEEEEESDEEEAAMILEQATQAARKAALTLHNRKPASTMGYLKTRTDGSVGLKFLAGCEGTNSPPYERSLNLGMVLGKLSTGAATLHNYHDDKRTMAKPVKGIHYGSYSSFCPSYDSTFANLSKEESDLVRATYGNETAVQYAESICEFSRDCNMATTLVDQLLNLLTSSHHSRTRATITAARQEQQQQPPLQQTSGVEQQQQDNKADALSKSTAAPESSASAGSMSNLRSLSSLGIDVSFLDSFEQLENSLSGSARLVQGLAAEQNSRLSKQSSTAPLTSAQPSHSEMLLAERLTAELVSVARQLPPSAILPAPAPPASS